MTIDNLEILKSCSHFEHCGAPLCPIDNNLKQRLWFADEPVCTSRTFGSGLRWIRKQRSIKRRNTQSYQDRSITYQELFDNSKKKILSVEVVEKLRQNMLQNARLKEIKVSV